MIESALESIRGQGGALLRKFLIGDYQLSPDQFASEEDHGLFGPDSVSWKVNADASAILGGVRSLLYQTLHPLAMAGVSDHSDYREDPFGRLQRTTQFVGATTFGSTQFAEQLIAVVRKVHDKVEGETPDGRPYSANDPRLLLWVHAVEVDSFLAAYKTYGAGELADWEADAYVAEMSIIAKRLGATNVPTSVSELAECLEGFKPEMEVGEQAKEGLRFLFAPPLPLWSRGPYGVLTAAAVTSLPTDIRKMMNIPVPMIGAVEPLAVRPAATALVRGLGWLLESGRTMPKANSADDS